MNNVDQDSQGHLYVLSPRGYSAYEVAVQQGFVGTEDEWLASLIGPEGPIGPDGKSAYEIAVENGYIGTETQWVNDFLTPDGYYNKKETDDLIDEQTRTTDSLAEAINVQKQRIDNLATLEEGSTTGDAELIDTRVGYNGLIYDDAGSSLRNQIQEIHDLLKENKISITSLSNNIENGSINTSGQNQASNSRIRTKVFFNVKQSFLNVTIKQGWKIYILGYNSPDVSDFDKNYTNWFDKDTTILKNITSDYLRFVIAKTDNSAITVADYTDDVFRFSYNDKNKLNEIDVNTAINETLTFLAPLYSKFKRTSFITGTTSFDPTPTRISCEEIQKLDVATKVYAKSNYEFNIIYFDQNDLTTYDSNSGWVTELEIPANQYFTISIKKTDTSNINVNESINIYTDISVSSDNTDVITPYPTQEVNLIDRVLKDKDANTLTFGVIADTHNGSGAYYRNSNQAFAINRLSEKIGVDFIAHLGDVIQGYDQKNTNKSYLNEYWEIQGNTYIPVLYCIGHHEMYGVGRESQYGEDPTAITKSECVGVCGFSNKYKNLIWSADKSSYYLDLSNNVRLIVLNSVSNTAKGFSSDVLDFLRDTLNVTGKKLIVMSHVPARKKLNAGNATVQNGDEVEQMLNNYDGTVLVYIHGHVHWDNIYKPENIKYPYYSVCCALPSKINLSTYACDEGNPIAHDRLLNDYSQYCFDIFNIHTDSGTIKSFRFGAGNDRTYNQ